MFFLNNMHLCFHSSIFCSTTGLVPCSATPTFGDLRAANGQGQQRRRITSVQPPSGLQEWLKMFQVTCLNTVLEMLHLIAAKNKRLFNHEKGTVTCYTMDEP